MGFYVFCKIVFEKHIYILADLIVINCWRYVAWNMHEAKEGQYDFSGDNDLVAFIEMANSAGLLVLVRAGDWT